MTIVHLTTVHSFEDNRILEKECAYLRLSGFDVRLLAHAVGESLPNPPPHVTLLGSARPSRLRRVPVGYYRAFRALRRVHPRPALLHLHDPELIPFGILYRLLSRVPVIYDSHEDLPLQIAQGKTYIPRPARKLLQFLGRTLEKAADKLLTAVVVATPRLAQNYSHPRTVLVQNFPWLSSFAEPSKYTPGGKFVYCGVIADIRGAQEMLRAISATEGAELHLAGRVPEVALLRQIESAGPRVNYHGIVHPRHIPEVVGGSQVGLCVLKPIPNYLEAQSTKLYEYMAAGRPFIASNFPYWVKQLGSLDAGLFVDPDDTAGIADAMGHLMNNPEEAERMGENGRRAVEEMFNFEKEGERLVSLYVSLLA